MFLVIISVWGCGVSGNFSLLLEKLCKVCFIDGGLSYIVVFFLKKDSILLLRLSLGMVRVEIDDIIVDNEVLFIENIKLWKYFVDVYDRLNIYLVKI